MISIRRARPSDAPGIGGVHVAAWRSAYPGILPDGFLSRLSAPRQAAYYDNAIRSGAGVYVAVLSGQGVAGETDGEGAAGGGSKVVGFATAARAGRTSIGQTMLGEGEIETLYVLDDWRDRGLGRRLMRASAAHLAAAGCRSAFVWVLRDNPSRWFYQRLGGRNVADASTRVGGTSVPQTAFSWDPIEKLIAASPAP